ncbi:MAG: right-handed parallel beta-helix repeat-containing protein [Acidobacteriota bacterium]
MIRTMSFIMIAAAFVVAAAAAEEPEVISIEGALSSAPIPPVNGQFRGLLQMLDAHFVKRTELSSDGPLDLYVDGANGDDSNDGLAPGTAKRTIQAAVDMVPVVLAGPATVHVADGVYRESVLIGRRQMRGSDHETIILEGNTASPSVIIDGEKLREQGVASNGTGVVIRGIRVTGFFEGIETGLGFTLIEQSWVDGNFEGIAVGTGSAEISDVTIEDNSFDGISIQGGEDIIIDRCTVRNNGHDGISIGQAGFLDIDDCDITGNGGNGIEVSGGSTLDCGHDCRLDIQGNGSHGVLAIDNSNASFSSSPNLAIQSLRAEFHSTIREHQGPCTNDNSSLCGPAGPSSGGTHVICISGANLLTPFCNELCGADTVVGSSREAAPCTVSSDTGSCTAIPAGGLAMCCVCAP